MGFLRVKDILALPGSFLPSLAVTAGVIDQLSWKDTPPPQFSSGRGNCPKVVRRVCRTLDGDPGTGWVSAW